MNIPRGTTIRFRTGLPSDFNSYVNVIIYIYAEGYEPIKFSYVQKTGYIKIPDDGLCVLTANMTKNMLGKLFYEIALIQDESVDGENIGNNGIFTGIVLTKTLISREL